MQERQTYWYCVSQRLANKTEIRSIERQAATTVAGFILTGLETVVLHVKMQKLVNSELTGKIAIAVEIAYTDTQLPYTLQKGLYKTLRRYLVTYFTPKHAIRGYFTRHTVILEMPECSQFSHSGKNLRSIRAISVGKLTVDRTCTINNVTMCNIQVFRPYRHSEMTRVFCPFSDTICYF